MQFKSLSSITTNTASQVFYRIIIHVLLLPIFFDTIFTKEMTTSCKEKSTNHSELKLSARRKA